MPSDGARTCYRQPVQARAFGTTMLAAGGLLVALLLGIRLFVPPTPASEAERTAVFVAESIPLDQSEPPPDPRPDPPPAAPTATVTPSPRVTETVPVPVVVPSVVVPAILSSPQAASAPVLPPPSMPAAKPVESPARPAAAASEAAAADWRARLLGHLKRYRRYPRQAEAARQQGVARVAITLRRSGEVVAVELVHGSGYPLLDMEARTTVQRASPLPAIDASVPGDPVTVEVPIDFALRR